MDNNGFRTMGWLVLLMLVVVTGAGCGKRAGKTQPQEAVGKEEESGNSVGNMSVADVMKARCSHGLTMDCAECRYEVGVVKVVPELLKKADVASTGLVATIQVKRQKNLMALELPGEIRLNENAAVHVSSRITGVIRGVNVDIGSEVQKGGVLFTIDSVELGEAFSQYEKHLALAELSGRSFQREKSLYDQKIGSENDLLEAQMRYEENLVGRKAAEQRLHVLGLSEADISGLNPTNHSSIKGLLDIRAPERGTVIEKHAVVGEWVEPGKDVMVLADLDTVWFWGGLNERDLGQLLAHARPEGLAVEIAVPAFPDTVFKGTLNHIGAVMDETTRTLPVRIVVANPDRRLRPGMYGRGRILLSSSEEVVAIPKSALMSDEGVNFVFVHMKDDYFLRVNVAKGREYADTVEITRGLAEGQTIVAEGGFVLKSDVLRSKMGAGCAD